MAFNPLCLNKIGVKSIYDRYKYHTDDLLSDVFSDNYFDLTQFNRANKTNPIIEVLASDGNTVCSIDDITGLIVSIPNNGMTSSEVENESNSNKYVTPRSGSDVDIRAALADSRTLGKVLLFSRGNYSVNSKLSIITNDKIEIAATATVSASSSIGNDPIFEIGTTTTYADYFRISGGGRIDGAGNANRCIDIIKARFSKINDLDIDGAKISAIRLGSSNADASSYEVDMSNIHIMHEQSQNISSSIGIYYENCNDSYASKVVIVGYRRGFEFSSSSYSNELSQTHVWGRVVHGALQRCYSIFGTVTLSQCNADTPFDVIGIGGDLYGFRMGSDSQGSLLRCFSNNNIGSDAQIDGRVIPFQFTGSSTNFNNVRVHGGSASRRFKVFSAGNTSTNSIVQQNSGSDDNYVTPP